MREEFINFINSLLEANPDIIMPENVQKYWNILQSQDNIVKPLVTENGAIVLKHLQTRESTEFKAKDVAEELFISSRSVSGSLRKLVTDGFVEKICNDPIIYTLTEKGKTFNFD